LRSDRFVADSLDLQKIIQCHVLYTKCLQCLSSPFAVLRVLLRKVLS